jgi:hypothetical protein
MAGGKRFRGSRGVRKVQIGIVDRSVGALRALRHAERVRSESGEVDGFKFLEWSGRGEQKSGEQDFKEGQGEKS